VPIKKEDSAALLEKGITRSDVEESRRRGAASAGGATTLTSSSSSIKTLLGQ
jgi:hypothetical protein